MILSFHPCITGDHNIICAGRNPNSSDLAAIRRAKAVILPQGCKLSLYQLARKNCPHVFPNYDARFNYPGKLNQIKLFSDYNAPYPRTKTVRCLDDQFFNPLAPDEGFNFPFVFKFDWGGEGDFVYLIQTRSDLDKIIKQAEKYEKTGQKGFLLQAFVPAGHRSLRVVVINKRFISYWRVHKANDFYSNLSKGADIDHHSDKHLQNQGIYQVKSFCQKTNINLAGFDILFSEHNALPRPLFIEINYFFGRNGLGGSERYYQLLETEIASWIKQLPAS